MWQFLAQHMQDPSRSSCNSTQALKQKATPRLSTLTHSQLRCLKSQVMPPQGPRSHQLLLSTSQLQGCYRTATLSSQELRWLSIKKPHSWSRSRAARWLPTKTNQVPKKNSRSYCISCNVKLIILVWMQLYESEIFAQRVMSLGLHYIHVNIFDL